MPDTARVIHGLWVDLRPLRREDLAKRLEMANNPDVQRMTVGVLADESSKADMENWFFMMGHDPYSEQWAVLNKSGEYIGDIDFHSIHVMPGEAWISPMIGHPAAMKEAQYRREAIALIAAYAFSEKQVQKLCIDVPNTDQQGIDILTSLGFELTEETLFEIFTNTKILTYELRPERFFGQSLSGN